MEVWARYTRSPYRTTAWPWVEANKLVDRRRYISRRRDHPVVIDVVPFVRQWRRCHSNRDLERLSRKWPELYAAHQLAQTHTPLRAEVEARILARQSDAEIAERCSLTPNTIRWFEHIFFHVRECLQANDWIILSAVRIYDDPTDEPLLGRIWKLFGYKAGPRILDTTIAVTLNRPLPFRIPRQDELLLRFFCKLNIAMLILPDQHLGQVIDLYIQAKRLGFKTDAPNPISIPKLEAFCSTLALTKSQNSAKGKNPVKQATSTQLPTPVEDLIDQIPINLSFDWGVVSQLRCLCGV